jgi:NAD(P)-dependent dehydrogenase (short-subunit alcohol dehydrogenase family)
MADDILRNPLSLFDVSGKVTVITGASGALGRAAAIALGALGTRLLLASGSAAGLAEVAAAARDAGGEVTTLACRPDTQSDADGILAAATAAYGAVDSVLVASGYNKPAPIEEMPYEDWQAIMDANVRGPWLMAKAFGRHLASQPEASQLVTSQGEASGDGASQGGTDGDGPSGSGTAGNGAGGSGPRRSGRGKLVLVSSVRGRHGSPAGYSAYCTSKGATDSLTKTLATEWGPRGINVNAIAPAVFRSALTEWIFSDTDAGRASRERNMARISLKRLGEPEDFVGIVLYLLSAASDFVTGQVIYVDGGYTAA